MLKPKTRADTTLISRFDSCSTKGGTSCLGNWTLKRYVSRPSCRGKATQDIYPRHLYNSSKDDH
ncbi:hypothetical protein SynROS8604_01962 [Synechococcus sp. ROS8604]|nr:hypothetical protein SynROS8604_01962 [Synechococcus sp. ROS8604]